MIDIVLEMLLWALKFCTSVLELFSAIKKSRHSGPNRVERDKFLKLIVGNHRLSAVPFSEYKCNDVLFGSQR